MDTESALMRFTELSCRFALILFADADRDRAGFGADVEADAASRTAGSGVGNRIVTLAVQ